MFDVFRYGVQVTGKDTTFPRLVSWETMFSKRIHCRCPLLESTRVDSRGEGPCIV